MLVNRDCCGTHGRPCQGLLEYPGMFTIRQVQQSAVKCATTDCSKTKCSKHTELKSSDMQALRQQLDPHLPSTSTLGRQHTTPAIHAQRQGTVR